MRDAYVSFAGVAVSRTPLGSSAFKDDAERMLVQPWNLSHDEGPQ
ncbi:hypothetical protein [Corynebacterium comes]|nr:hypothetical protein [Corynebacterium comes]